MAADAAGKPWGDANAALDGAGEYHECVPPGTRWWGGHFRAEALRASRLYPVNYKFVPPGTRNGSRRGGASRGGAKNCARTGTAACDKTNRAEERQSREISRMAAKIW
jgi:hypothetical protein